MKYAIIGNNDGPKKILQSLLRSNSQLPELVGLQKNPGQALLSDMQRFPVPCISDFDEAHIIELLSHHDIDVLINCFANFKFNHLLEKYDCYNIHPSLLPAYKGRHPMHWALINGEQTTGISIHGMTGKIDEGPVYWQQKVTISATDSVHQLRERLLEKLEAGFSEFMRNVKNNALKPIQNMEVTPSYFPPRKPKDSQLFEWSDPGKIYRKIMALRSTDHPAFITMENGGHIKIKDAKWMQGTGSSHGILQAKMDEGGAILISFPNGQRISLDPIRNVTYDLSRIQWNREEDPAD